MVIVIVAFVVIVATVVIVAKLSRLLFVSRQLLSPSVDAEAETNVISAKCKRDDFVENIIAITPLFFASLR